MLSLEIKGLPEMVEDMRQAGAQSDVLVKAALQNSVTLTQKNVRQEAPHKTGSLQRSVLTEVAYPSASVTVNEKYGTMVEEGTKPHTITAKNGKALFWKGALNPYKSVKHPGTKPNPFFQRGVTRSDPLVQQQFVKVLERLVKIMAGK